MKIHNMFGKPPNLENRPLLDDTEALNNAFVWAFKVGNYFDIPECCRTFFSSTWAIGPPGLISKHTMTGKTQNDVWVACLEHSKNFR